MCWEFLDSDANFFNYSRELFRKNGEICDLKRSGKIEICSNPANPPPSYKIAGSSNPNPKVRILSE
jgi:hypothetical protein